jgi:hypothetical protein
VFPTKRSQRQGLSANAFFGNSKARKAKGKRNFLLQRHSRLLGQGHSVIQARVVELRREAVILVPEVTIMTDILRHTTVLGKNLSVPLFLFWLLSSFLISRCSKCWISSQGSCGPLGKEESWQIEDDTVPALVHLVPIGWKNAVPLCWWCAHTQ